MRRVVRPIDSFTGKYAFLSNFYPAEVRYKGRIYPTVEHAYQAAKENTSEYRTRIRKAPTPGAAKRLGRTARLRSDWDSVKLSIMEGFLWQKFSDDIEIKLLLLSTYERPLIEGNAWGDVYWGVCRGRGENNLGKLLMKIRSLI